jgi:hypothetical protein
VAARLGGTIDMTAPTAASGHPAATLVLDHSPDTQEGLRRQQHARQPVGRHAVSRGAAPTPPP